jgi:ATP-dependent DNA ligase
MVQYVRAPKTPQPRFVEPMECQRVSKLPEGDDWWYEIKHDGYRIVAVLSGADVVLHSFSGLDYTERFPAVAFALRQMRLSAAVFDGELVALDAQGRSNFQELQNYRHTKLSIVYYVFDILHLEGRDLTKLSQGERRKSRAEVFDTIKGLKTDHCPFANLPEPKRSKHALTAERMKECAWVLPERQCEVEFVEWTRNGHLRHPKFRRLVG